MAAESVWVGVDLGTQSVRALAVTDTGQVRGSASRPLESARDDVRHEQDPLQWWQAVGEACSEALADVAAHTVAGVAVDATSGTVLLVDDAGEPVTPGLMYDDTRATVEAERVNEMGAAYWAELGYQQMQPAWALPKLLWLLSSANLEACSYTAAGAPARIAHQSDVITARLVGEPVATDLSNALKTGAHLIEERWPTELFDQLGVPPDLFPPLVRPGTKLGAVCARAAAATGLPVGTPVIAGTTDGCASQLGAGATELGSWNSVLGTTLVLKGVTDQLVQDPFGAVYSHRSPDGGWLPGGASSAGAGAISAQLPGRDLDALSAHAHEYEHTDVLAYPLASRKGERFPFVAPEASGFVLGRPQADTELYAALIQGVAFVERLCFDYLDLLGAPTNGRVVFTGGGTSSRYWSQLRADLLGRSVTLPDNASSALGMAVLAAASEHGTAGAGQAMVRMRETIDPRAGVGERFCERYLRLVAELERRGWLPAEPAAHARARASA